MARPPVPSRSSASLAARRPVEIWVPPEKRPNQGLSGYWVASLLGRAGGPVVDRLARHPALAPGLEVADEGRKLRSPRIRRQGLHCVVREEHEADAAHRRPR